MNNIFDQCQYLGHDGIRCNRRTLPGSQFCKGHTDSSIYGSISSEQCLLNAEQFDKLYQKSFKICPKCGYVQSSGAVVCRRCGRGGGMEHEYVPDSRLPATRAALEKALPAILEAIKNPEPEKVKKGLFISLILNLLFFAMLFYFFLFYVPKKEKAIVYEKAPVVKEEAAVPSPAVPVTAAVPQAEKPEIKEEPVKEETVSPKTQEEVKAVVENWRRAWEGKDFSKYMSFYSRDFEWGKRQKLNSFTSYKKNTFSKSKNVQVRFKSVEVLPEGDGRVLVTFLQEYGSNLVNDRGAKNLHLKKEPEGWKIVREDFKSFK